MTKAINEGFEYRIYDRLKRKYILRIYKKYETVERVLENMRDEKQDWHRFELDLKMIGGRLPWKY